MCSPPTLARCANVRHLARESVKNDWRDRKQTGLLIGPPWDRNQTTGETNRQIVRVTSRNVLVQSAHFLQKVGTPYCGTYCPLLHNTRTWLARQENSWDRSVCHGFNDMQNADICALKPFAKSWPPFVGRRLCSSGSTANRFKPHQPWSCKSCIFVGKCCFPPLLCGRGVRDLKGFWIS